jgi:hypothetical protein
MNGYDEKQWNMSFSETGQDAKNRKNTFKPTVSILPRQSSCGTTEEVS